MYADDTHLTFAANTVSSIDKKDLSRLKIGFLQTSSFAMHLKLSLFLLDQDKDYASLIGLSSTFHNVLVDNLGHSTILLAH